MQVTIERDLLESVLDALEQCIDDSVELQAERKAKLGDYRKSEQADAGARIRRFRHLAKSFRVCLTQMDKARGEEGE